MCIPFNCLHFRLLLGCDKCIWDLTDDISLAIQSIEESKEILLSISTGVAAHKHLHDLNATTFILKVPNFFIFQSQKKSEEIVSGNSFLSELK